MSTEKNTILLAEDSKTNRTVFTHLLHKLGFDVIECENGRIALDVLNDPEKSKDVLAIVSDIMMPEMDGISLLREVRSHDSWKDINFLLVTAVMDKDQVLEAKNLNVNGYILKPVTFKRVSEKLKQLFPDRKYPLAG